MQSKTSVRSFSRVLVTLAWTLALVGAVAAPSYAEGGAQKPPAAERVTGPVNVNTASAAELEKLPGIGPAVAGRIIEYRQKNGGFKKLEDLMNVRGIGEKTFLKLKPMLTLTPPKATLL
jgi:competence protein ComEA